MKYAVLNELASLVDEICMGTLLMSIFITFPSQFEIYKPEKPQYQLSF